MADTKAILKEMEQQIVLLAENSVSKYKSEAIADGKTLLKEIKEDLIRWMELLAKKQIKTSEFEWLVNSNKELVKMTALKNTGLAAIRTEQFGMGVLNVITDIALKKITS